MGHLGGEKIQRSEQVRADQTGQRVDQAAAELFEGFSRSRLQGWIKDGVLTVNGAKVRPKDKLVGNESLTLEVEIAPELDDQPQSIELDVVYQDDDLIVINKPTGLVVHPAAGHADGTLLNGLLHLDERLNSLPRAGIVHRLDRDTTGLMVVARSRFLWTICWQRSASLRMDSGLWVVMARARTVGSFCRWSSHCWVMSGSARSLLLSSFRQGLSARKFSITGFELL